MNEVHSMNYHSYLNISMIYANSSQIPRLTILEIFPQKFNCKTAKQYDRFLLAYIVQDKMQGFVLPVKCLLISNVSPLALEALIASDYMNISQTTVQLNVGFNQKCMYILSVYVFESKCCHHKMIKSEVLSYCTFDLHCYFVNSGQFFMHPFSRV